MNPRERLSALPDVWRWVLSGDWKIQEHEISTWGGAAIGIPIFYVLIVIYEEREGVWAGLDAKWGLNAKEAALREDWQRLKGQAREQVTRTAVAVLGAARLEQGKRYWTTTSHKLIGVFYEHTALAGGATGGTLAVLMRLELITPGAGLMRDIRELYTYNSWITTHGLTMLFLLVMPMAIGAFGNYWIPFLMGTSELAFPRLNAMSWWMLWMGLLMLITAPIIWDKPLAHGWTLYPPLTTREVEGYFTGTDISIFGVHLVGLASAFNSVNVMATIKHHRHEGLTNSRDTALRMDIIRDQWDTNDGDTGTGNRVSRVNTG